LTPQLIAGNRDVMARKKKTAEMKIRCEKELKEEISRLALKEERSLSAQVVFLLKLAIKNHYLGD
jgi:hypothetical protein